MNVYVVGAGVSHQVGYPLGGQLFSDICLFIGKQGASLDREYVKDWPKLCGWLESNRDPLVHAAYTTGNIENILTALDFARTLRDQCHQKAWLARGGPSQYDASDAQTESPAIDHKTDPHLFYSCMLRWALVRFFQQKHREDLGHFQAGDSGWTLLRRFGERVKTGDVVLTFNYDAALERVLLDLGKWNPCLGYGLGPITLASRAGEAHRLWSGPSAVRVFHLHGSFGWYMNFSPSSTRGTRISLSTDLLEGLGVAAEDVTWESNDARSNPSHVDPIIIYPSFFKEYDDWKTYGAVVEVWRRAAKALRAADNIYIVGYSLPPGDSAALTFVVTNCDRRSVKIINSCRGTCVRLRQLLGPRSGLLPNVYPPVDFEEWVKTGW